MSTQDSHPGSKARRARRIVHFPRIEILEARIAPATLTWDGSAGDGNWFNAQNWDGNAVPDNDDIAVLNSASIINLTASTTVGSFQLSVGTLTSPAGVTLTVSNSLSWTSGTMSGAGPTSITKIAATGTLLIDGAATKTLQQHKLINDGTTIWSDAGNLLFNGGGVFENGGSFIAQNNAFLQSVGSGNSFSNKAGGSFDKNTGTGTTEVQVAFANAGTVTAASGTLQFTGAFNQSAGLTRLSGGIVGTSSVLTLAGGELTGNGTIAGNLENTGATIRPGTTGAGLITVNGNFTQSSSGMLAIQIGGTTAVTQYDQLNVTGTANLGGALTSVYINSFTSTTGNVFNVLTAGTRNGTFATVDDVGLLNTVYTATQVQFQNNVISYVWDGSAGDGNWFTPANWTPSGVPGASDAAFLTNGQTINLPSSTLVGFFQQSAGTFTSPAGVTFTVLQEFNWTAGTMSGAGVTNANGGLAINGQVLLDRRTLSLPAGQTATFSAAGDLLFSNNATFNNAGTFLVQSDTQIRPSTGTGVFNNTGTFIRNTGTGIFDIGVPFANSGTVNVATGTLNFTGGESGATTGDFNVASGATLRFASNFSLATSVAVSGLGAVEFAGGTVAIGGTFAIPTVRVINGTNTFNVPTTGLQSLTVSSGTANFATTDTINLTALTISGGTLSGTNTINVAGLSTWTGGVMAGTGVTNANGGLAINGQVVLDRRTLNLPAGQTATFSASGDLLFSNNATFNNAGTFLVQSDTQIRPSTGTGVFNNTGTFTRSTGTGVFDISVPFANSGTVNVTTGSLSFTAGESGTATSGDFNVASGATLRFASNFNLSASADVSGAGAVEFTAGTATIGGAFAVPTVRISGGTANFNVPTTGLQSLTVSFGTINFATTDTINLTTLTVSGGTLTSTNTINVANLFTWTGGTMSGAGVTNANGGLLLTTGNAVLDERTLNNPVGQTATISGPDFVFTNGGIFNNAGTFLAQIDRAFRSNDGTGTFNNTGTVTRTTAAGDFEFRVAVNNSGTLNGTLMAFTFTAGFSQSASASIVGGNAVSFSGGTVNAGGMIVGNVTNSGAVFSPGGSGAGELAITGNYVQTAGTFKIDLGGAAAGQFDKLTVSGTASLAGTLNIALVGGFTPLAAQQFAVLSDAAQTGTFSSLTGTPGFTASYQANGLVLNRNTISYTWDAGGGVDTSWFNPANWGPDGVPSASDSATLSSSATITLGSAASVFTFTQSSGILIGTGTLAATTFNWSGGTQAGTGTTTIPVGGTFNLQGTATKTLTQRTFDLGGTGTWTGTGILQLGNGAIFHNTGTFNVQSDPTLEVTVGGTQPLFANAGTLHKTGGAGTTTFNGLRFENSGTVRVSAGTLSLAGASGSFIQATGATILSGGNLSAASVLRFSGGVLSGVGTITGNVANDAGFILPGGVGTAGALTITGAYSQGPTARLSVEIGGTAANQIDRLSVGGAATLDGSLDVSLLAGFAPAAGQEYSVLTYASRTGSLTGPASFPQEYRATGLVLKPGFPTLTIADVAVAEGSSGPTLATFTVSLSPPSTQIVSVRFATADDTATAGEDYTARSLTTLTFNPGETSKTITVIVNGDTQIEASQTFLVNLSDATNAGLGDSQARGTILNDDIVLAINARGKTATFTEADGDRVTVQTTLGTLSAENFAFAPDGTLALLDLRGNSGLAGTSLTISAAAGAGGNGVVNVGAIRAIGLDLGTVTIDGDLGQIDVGDVNGATPALRSLMVGSLGLLGAATQPAGTRDPLQSDIRGSIGTFRVVGDFTNAVVNVFVGGIGSINIGGTLDGSGGGLDAGLISVRGHIGAVTIEGGIIGGANRSGIIAGGTIGKITLGADLRSDDAAKPVTILAEGRLGTLARTTPAIAGLTVEGEVLNARILARTVALHTAGHSGYTAAVGDVVVNGNWTASSLAAGVADRSAIRTALPDGFGRNDLLVDRGIGALTSRIASIIIGGTASGAAGDGFFGITARKIGSAMIGGQTLPLTDSADSRLLDPLRGNFRLVDFA